MKDLQRNIVRGYKPIVIRYLALVIGVCYLANPLQNQISSVFHEISHFLEVPDTAIGHSTLSDKQKVEHHYHEHTHKENQHEHTLIDILDSIFDASDDGSQEESLLVDVKFDKHIAIDEYPVYKAYTIEKSLSFVSNEKKLQNGHSNILKEPPQNAWPEVVD